MSFFEFKIDAEIKHIWFFKKNERILKKMYIYVTQDNNLIIKGLPLKKSDGSKIGYAVFKKHMRENVINGDIKFTYEQVNDWAQELLTNNLMIAARSFKVMKNNQYKNENQLQRQISIVYGEGRHQLIPNNKVGVGKSTRFCTFKEFEAAGLNTNAVNLDKMWSELECFVKDMPVKQRIVNTSKGRVLRIVVKDHPLMEWTNIEI